MYQAVLFKMDGMGEIGIRLVKKKIAVKVQVQLHNCFVAGGSEN